ncbi:MAG: tryptophan 2,3-dioxygenase family protein [Candidatus Marinimicrobia bacterium]|jgi:tryptophan 2,3-dioxygenase|nr:tryptophan 2,3-dioxygenase family protein [Candidatus Neomarinimicrobiota bacterium]MDP6789920.1 tryptophan 2,3-dioxygenase family protein [Candidatus Neomarinimicrobiota bacterium]MDP7072824.1 tryptophan 2,3-dioxygenase family protein [Candidatus Neomarinimicrobiota bacterium]
MKKDSKSLYYKEYLKLDELLSIQSPRSKELGKEAHDETLFIIVHQVYELWFKLFLHELDFIIKLFREEEIDESNIGRGVAALNRILEIQELSIRQIRLLETMTALDFLEFRDFLFPASGFQSVQFRLIENKLGLDGSMRLKYGSSSYKMPLKKSDESTVTKSENQPSLFSLIEAWLERTPFLEFKNFLFWDQYSEAVKNMLAEDRKRISENPNVSADEKAFHLKEYASTEANFDAIIDDKAHDDLIKSGHRRLSHKATQAALLIFLYRDHPILHLPFKLLSKLIDLDESLTAWRHQHALLAQRMIGTKIGTGGTTGNTYLSKAAETHKVFTDFANLSTYLIPRSALPDLPENIIKNLGFYYSPSSDS